MPDKTSITELMVPLSEYASVGEDETLDSALRALRDAQRKLPPGKQSHRAILVCGHHGNIIGKIGYFVILDALLPWHHEEFQAPLLRSAGVNEEMARQTMDNLALLQDNLPDVCHAVRNIRVGDLTLKEAITIDHDVSLVTAMSLLVEHQTLALLVRRDDYVVGVLRLSDIFDHLFQRILACEDEPENS